MLIKKYSPGWIHDFESLKRQIEIALPGLNYTIEHVGSTSVPGLDSKPIIDTDIIYSTPADFMNIKRGLEKAGYSHHGNQDIQHRDVFKRSGNSENETLDGIPHHLYVCLDGSEALERHISTRNYLRKHDWARMKYQEMKYDLAEKAKQDRKIYAILKEIHMNEFIDWMVEEEGRVADVGGLRSEVGSRMSEV